MIHLRPATVTRLRDRLKQVGARPSVVISSDNGILARAGLLPPEEQAAVRAVAPAVEAMYIMMAADGHVGEEERSVIRGAVREVTDSAVRNPTLEVLLDSCQEALEWDGQEARIQNVGTLLREDTASAENAFVLAAVVAFADEVIADEENEVLNALADALGISEERANELLDELEHDWNE